MKEELGEAEAEMRSGDRERLEGEFGDLFFALVNAARLYGIDPESALERTNRKVHPPLRPHGAAGRSRRPHAARAAPRTHGGALAGSQAGGEIARARGLRPEMNAAGMNPPGKRRSRQRPRPQQDAAEKAGHY